MSSPMLAARPEQNSPTRVLLMGGVAAAPVFCGMVLLQAVLQPGFNLLTHPLSLLTVGPEGWVQRGVFILSGGLVLAGVAGLRSATTQQSFGALLAVLFCAFGAGTSLAGVFVPDAAMGFPPGTPQGVPATMSMHSVLHGVCFDIAFLSLIIAMFVAGLDRRRPATWRRVSLSAGTILPIIIIAGMATPSLMGGFFFAAATIAFGWVSATFLAGSRRTPAQM